MIARLLLLAILAVPAIAHAEPDTMAEARRYMQVTGKQALIDTQVEGLRPVAMSMLAENGVPVEKRSAVAEKLIMPDLHAASAELMTAWMQIYAADISAEDMQATEAFFATPAGQHLLASEAQIANSVRDVTVAWAKTALQAAFDKHQDELRSAALLQE